MIKEAERLTAYSRFVRLAGKCDEWLARFLVFFLCAAVGLAANVHIALYAGVHALLSETGVRQMVLGMVGYVSVVVALCIFGCALRVVWRLGEEEEVYPRSRAVLLSLLFVTLMLGAFLGLALIGD